MPCSFQIRLSIYDFSGQIEKSREIDVVIISRAQRCYLTNANPAISFMGRMKVISYKLLLSAEAYFFENNGIGYYTLFLRL